MATGARAAAAAPATAAGKAGAPGKPEEKLRSLFGEEKLSSSLTFGRVEDAPADDGNGSDQSEDEDEQTQRSQARMLEKRLRVAERALQDARVRCRGAGGACEAARGVGACGGVPCAGRL
jgi:hypothetical protein